MEWEMIGGQYTNCSFLLAIVYFGLYRCVVWHPHIILFIAFMDPGIEDDLIRVAMHQLIHI